MKRTNPTLLIVDDDPDDLLLIQSAFEAMGVTSELQLVCGGDEAVAYVKGEGKYADRSVYKYPAFVITDLKMPGINGFGLLRFLRENPDSATLPVFVLSGSRDDADIRKSYLLGATSYHAKPGNPRDLRALVKTLHAYWMTCELPETDDAGRPLESNGRHKLD